MLVKTKHFGEIELQEDKIIHFEQGILGFEDYKMYTILFDTTEGERPFLSWLQCIEEPALAIPVISPYLLMPEYKPEAEDEIISFLGELTNDNTLVLSSVTVPKEIHDITINLKAPFIINSELRKGCQIIAQNADYEIKHKFYDQLIMLKTVKGDSIC